ncbi:hypothetical protein B0H13DRAFT_1872757 [Mycena leptocephala]|nr:hypothetical protein B0H13DRAFT_1872757 [Mycena leptocephala]
MERSDVNLDSPDTDDVNAVEDGDWTEGQVGQMYGSPLDAHQRQQKLNDERTLRRIKRSAKRQKYLKALTAPPSKERTDALFTDEALNAIHPGGELFESRPPEIYSAVARPKDGPVSCNLNFIHEHEIVEEDRRKKLFFVKEPKPSST